MKLIPDNKYKIKTSGKLCHIYSESKGIWRESNEEEVYDAIFVGKITTHLGKRNIFVNITQSDVVYFMYGAEDIDYVDIECGDSNT